MNLSSVMIEKEAHKILLMINSGELRSGCCMSAIQTPITEVWEKAQDLTEKGSLLAIEKNEIFSKLNKTTQAHLEFTGYDDFDLVYERLLQLINEKSND